MSDNFDMNREFGLDETNEIQQNEPENPANNTDASDSKDDPIKKAESLKASKKGEFLDIAGKKENKAPFLNRTLILAIAVGLFLFVILFVLISGEKKKTDDQKDDEILSAERVYVPDFDRLAKNNYDYALETEEPVSVEEEAFIDESITLDSIDEKLLGAPVEEGVAPVYQNQNQPQYQGGGGGGGKRRPDTRDNQMQRNISGIKGLTKQTAQNTPQQGVEQQNNPYAYLQNLQNNLEQNLGQNLLAQQGMMGMYLNPNQIQNQNEQNFYNNNFGGTNQGEFLPSLSLWQGTIIPAVLLTGIDTGLPGSIVARVTKNIYSSLDGKFLLIPQGALLLAEYNSSVGYEQNRVQVGWTGLIRPDGYFIRLANMPAVDAQGYVGIKGKVDTHFWAFIKGLALVSAISVVDTDINKSVTAITDPYTQNVIDSLRPSYQSIQDKIIDKALNIEPSIKVTPGKEINVLVNNMLFLPPVPVPKVKQKYIRRK